MKIAVTAKGKTIEDQVDPRFGRCPYFLVVDTETMDCLPVENTNNALGGGVGIQSAQLMAEHDAKIVLTGNCGPNAYRTLDAAGIQVIVGVSGTVREAIAQFKSGALSSTQGSNVASHSGTGGNTAHKTNTEGQTTMKIAIPVANGKLCAHFGHCEQFALLDVDEQARKVSGIRFLTPPAHEPGVLPRWLHEEGANIILAGGMGQRAQALFVENGIKVVVGASGHDPEQLAMQYLDGTLTTGHNVCDH